MRLNSLALRLFATSAAWTLLALPLAGYIIYSLYREDVQLSFDAQLKKLLTQITIDSMSTMRRRAGHPAEPLRAAVRSDAIGLVLADPPDRRRARPHARFAVAGDRCPAISLRSQISDRRYRNALDERPRPDRHDDPHSRIHQFPRSRSRQDEIFDHRRRSAWTGSRRPSPNSARA